MDGKCYGYFHLSNVNQLHIERIDKVFRNQDSAENVTVIWCAIHPERGPVVIGWYENATVHRTCMNTVTTPITGIERCYWIEAKAEDAYLLPEEDRYFEIERASEKGHGKGLGQSNIWYADSTYAQEELIPLVNDYIKNHRMNRINMITDDFLPPRDLSPLTAEEQEIYKASEDLSLIELLQLGYRNYENNKTAENAFDVADILAACYQYELAIPYYEKTLELDPDDFQTMGTLAYTYEHCGKYREAIKLAEKMFNITADDNIRDELYCVLADNHKLLGEIAEAISYQDMIIKDSTNKELIDYTQNN